MILTLIVLFAEVLYYALFMKLARKEGRLYRYILSFILVNIILFFVGTNAIYIYLLSILLMLYSIKYIVRINITIYDMFFLFIIMLIKIVIEGICCFLFFNYVNTFIFIMIIDFIKLLFIFLFRKRLNIFYNYMKLKWKNNNFYIRYIFNILMFIYVLMSCFFLINR